MEQGKKELTEKGKIRRKKNWRKMVFNIIHIIVDCYYFNEVQLIF